MEISGVREFLVEQPFNIATEMDEILSMNIVGSFAETDDLSGASDIDAVVIVDHLTEWTFSKVIDGFERVASPLRERFGLELRINSTFGPLKFNEPNVVVYHVMVYDVAGHILHCRRSPFTCYDWQRTRLYFKRHISEVHEVRCLMPHFFFNARRGVQEYLADLEKSIVSYRAYGFQDGEAFEERHEKSMTIKDRFEYAYHIVRFLMINFVKMHDGVNRRYENDELVARFLEIFPAFSGSLPEFFAMLSLRKRANDFSDETDAIEQLRVFLEAFEKAFYELFPTDGSRVSFCRHAKTSLNDGSLFIGQTLDPDIEELEDGFPRVEVNCVFSSPAKRAKQTAQRLAPTVSAEESKLLSEIDYGEVEGKRFAWLAEAFPEVVRQWSEGGDPAFPGGESQEDVLVRIRQFLMQLDECNENALVVTHNVWLRCFLGTVLNISMRNWYKMDIPHCQIFAFQRRSDGRLLPDFSQEDIGMLCGKLEREHFEKLQLSVDEDVEERMEFWSRALGPDAEIMHEAYDGTLLVPMAGEGARFQNYGFSTTKPLINVESQKMIERVVSCLPCFKHSIFAVRDRVLSSEVEATLRKTSDRVDIVPVSELTEGQACTCLLGIEHAAQAKPLLVAPCDNGMIWQDVAFKRLLSESKADVVCWTFTKHLSISDKPEAWGYVLADADGNALSVSVKKPFTQDPYSEHCIVGTFWFRSAKLFKDLANELIDKDIRVNGEFYVDSIVGLAASKGLVVKIFDVDCYISWGTPEALLEYRKWNGLLKLF